MSAARAIAAFVLLVSATVLWLGDRSLDAVHAASAWAEGRGAEEPLLCSFRARTGVPCVGCGGTTAFGHAARGRWRAALQANALGAFAGMGAWGLLFASAASLGSGRAASLRWTGLGVGIASPMVFLWTLITWWTALPPGPGR